MVKRIRMSPVGRRRAAARTLRLKRVGKFMVVSMAGLSAGLIIYLL